MKKTDYLEIINIIKNSRIDSIEFNELLWIINSLIDNSIKYSPNLIDRAKFVFVQLEDLYKKIKWITIGNRIKVATPNSTHKHHLDIIKILKYYFYGKIYSSQRSFVLWFNSLNPSINYQEIEGNFYTYRGRIRENIIKFSPKDLLHIPFEKRNLVGNYRYSISGFPALYLATTIFCSWEELRRPSLSDLTIASFRPRNKWNLLDMRIYREFKTSQDLSDYLEILPLIISCSFPIASEQGTFHPEYIIPQFIMASLVSERYSKIFDGISYNSTRINRDMTFTKETIFNKYNNGYNVVLPVISDIKEGHCPVLLDKLYQSDTVSFDQFLIENDLYVQLDKEISILKKWQNHIINKKMDFNHVLYH